ncbi:tRNA pseudouridine(13) synthase TruD [Candidatus Woesearchaeota archaeon]|nr:tRNA pseudouridine(13) synthase TruD [Candidatus Woesearchaeota archaeon]
MYIIKQLPEDFVVTEISNVKLKLVGKYQYYKIIKKNRNTLDVIKQLAKILHCKEKEIGFAGSKDRRAITEQVISMQNVKKEKVLSLTIDNVSLKFLGYGDEPLTLGQLQGNYFEIVVRNIEKKIKIEKIKLIENYFDEQRFGRHNVKIGKFLLKKQFSEAVKLIEDTRMKAYLEHHKNDFIGALKLLPVRHLKMYVNAYQSFLWNETVAEFLNEKGKKTKETIYSQGKLIFAGNTVDFAEEKIPLLGFDFQETKKPWGEIISSLLQKENLSPSDFIIKQIPELTAEGELRQVVVEVKDLSIGNLQDDELNQGMKKVKLTFSLPKGSYATMVVRKIFTPFYFRS